MPRGNKTCPSCKTNTGPRTKICACGYDYFSSAPPAKAGVVVKKERKRKQNGELRKKREPKSKPLHWKELRKGDQIKLVNGSGPRYVIDDKRIPIGYKGQYKVLYLDDNGIHAMGIGKKSVSGHAYIWMNGKQRQGAFYRRPHKIAAVRRYLVENES